MSRQVWYSEHTWIVQENPRKLESANLNAPDSTQAELPPECTFEGRLWRLKTGE